MQQLQQQDWCEQQIAEKEKKAQLAKNVDMLYDAQADEYNKMLSMTQSEHNRLRLDNEKDTQNVNRILMQEKKDKDQAAHDIRKAAEATEINHTNNTDFMTENPQTEVSMLAPHRVKPYHFKGFNDERKEAVMFERSVQMKEQTMMKNQEKAEEQAYAR